MKKFALLSKSLEDYMKLLISFGFSILMIKLIWEGSIIYFINPNLIPMVIFCILALVLTSIITFLNADSKVNKNKFKLSYLIYIIPILIGFITPAQTITNATFQAQSNALQNYQALKAINNDKGAISPDRASELAAEDNNINEDSGVVNGLDNGVDNSAPIQKKTKIEVDEKNYSIEIDRINMYPEEYENCEIEISGRVYRNEKMKDGDFAIIRPMMTCCSADAALVGLYCKNGDKAKSDNWVKIKGKINMTSFDSKQIPAITINTITDIEKPKNEYIYQY